MSFDAPEIFYNLNQYYLRELLGDDISFLDIDLTGQTISMSEEDLKVILNDEKLQETTPYHTLYPLFKKTKISKDTKELDSKYWKLLKAKKLPTDFSTNSREDLLYWLRPQELESESVEELRELLSDMNKEVNSDEILNWRKEHNLY